MAAMRPIMTAMAARRAAVLMVQRVVLMDLMLSVLGCYIGVRCAGKFHRRVER